MSDYKKINKSHKHSSYEVKIPVWNGNQNIRKPFANWSDNKSLEWWDGYNKSKHNRHSEFQKATFNNLTNAMCGLITVLSAQFEDIDFAPIEAGLSIGGNNDGMESSIGGYFRIKYPTDWDENEKYNFNLDEIENDSNPFDKFMYE